MQKKPLKSQQQQFEWNSMRENIKENEGYNKIWSSATKQVFFREKVYI